MENQDDENPLLANLEVAQIYMSALLSGDPYKYRPEEASTHPYFNPQVETLDLEDLEKLSIVLNKHIETLDLQFEKNMQNLDWRDVWSLEDIRRYHVSLGLELDLHRLWHLRTDLEDIVARRMEKVVLNQAKNLDLSSDELSAVKSTYRDDLMLALGAGSWGKKPRGEA